MRWKVRGGRHAWPALVVGMVVSAAALTTQACGGQAAAHSAPPSPVAYKSEAPRQGAWNFVSRRDLHPARLRVTASAGQAAPGYVFITPGSAQYGETGPLIVDGKGDPVWVGTVPRGQNATNFRVQTYQGRRVLTWWRGKVIMPGYGRGVDVIADSSYRTIATVHAANGLSADLHDFTITPDGQAIITAYKVMPYDLSSMGGSRHGRLLDSLVQVIDIASGKLVFQWDPLQHIPLSDSYMKPAKGGIYDPYHVNSAALDGSDSLMVSIRHAWSVDKVDMRTGDIVWRMGGKHSDLTLGAGVSFAWQHAAFPVSGGRLLLFDNEAAGTAAHARLSHALVLAVDEAKKTVTLVHSFTHPRCAREQSGRRAGAAQRRLPGGMGRGPVDQRVRVRRHARVGRAVLQDRPELPRLQDAVDGASH